MGMRPPTERVDADAVCARCGSINPEDTLICKVCGNNLRDQRAARLARSQIEEVQLEVVERRRWLSGILALIGGVLVLGVMLNLSRIEDGLVGILADSSGPKLGLWSGEDGQVLTKLAAELTTRPLTDEQIQEAMLSPLLVEDFSGRYVLAVPNEAEGILPVGEAVVQQDDDTYYFAGRTGTTEVRGKATVNSNGFLVAAWGSAGFRVGSEEHPVRGAAGRSESGGLECYGEIEHGEAGYNFMAYPVVPASAQ